LNKITIRAREDSLNLQMDTSCFTLHKYVHAKFLRNCATDAESRLREMNGKLKLSRFNEFIHRRDNEI